MGVPSAERFPECPGLPGVSPAIRLFDADRPPRMGPVPGVGTVKTVSPVIILDHVRYCSSLAPHLNEASPRLTWASGRQSCRFSASNRVQWDEGHLDQALRRVPWRCWANVLGSICITPGAAAVVAPQTGKTACLRRRLRRRQHAGFFIKPTDMKQGEAHLLLQLLYYRVVLHWSFPCCPPPPIPFVPLPHKFNYQPPWCRPLLIANALPARLRNFVLQKELSSPRFERLIASSGRWRDVITNG